MAKRKDYINWDEYFMGIAKFSAERSKDPSTQVGACIVSHDNRILSIGYNGCPNGFSDDSDMTWDRTGDFINSKYAYVCHAEENAILNYFGSKKDLVGSTVYVTLFPCNECAKIIIQSGIKKIVFESDKYDGTDSNVVAKKLFDACGVEYRQYRKSGKTIEINI